LKNLLLYSEGGEVYERGPQKKKKQGPWGFTNSYRIRLRGLDLEEMRSASCPITRAIPLKGWS